MGWGRVWGSLGSWGCSTASRNPFPLLNGAQADVPPHPQLAELLERSCLGISVSLPHQLLPSLPNPSSTFLFLGPPCKAFVPRLGTAWRRCRAVQGIQNVTPTNLLQPTGAQYSIWRFFTRKNIYFGRQKSKTENKPMLTNPKIRNGFRNPLVPFWMISYLKE